MRLVLLVATSLFACSGDDSGGTAERAGEGAPPGDQGSDAGAPGEDDAPAAPALKPLTWEAPEVVAPGVVGSQVRAVLDPAGAPAIAFLRPNGEEVACELTADEPFFPVTRRQYDLVWAARSADGAWAQDVVAQTDIVHGLGLAYDPAGAAYLAFLGGEPGTQWCAGSDMMLATRSAGAWSAAVTVQADSATGAACKKMQNVCNVGNVTGLWATLAVSDDGARVALAFQDIHFGFAKDDWESSDLEIAIGPGAWNTDTVHDSQGGGKWTSAAFNAEGKVALAWYNNKTGGVWFALEDTGGEAGDEGWPDEPVQVSHADPTYPLQLAALPDGGGYAVVYNDSRPDQTGLWYAQSEDGKTWVETPVDIGTNTGRSASMALDAWGRPVIAYGACNDANENVCVPHRDGIRLARWTGKRWDLTDVEGGSDPEVNEGSTVSLALTATGEPWVTFVRDRFDEATLESRAELRVVQGR